MVNNRLLRYPFRTLWYPILFRRFIWQTDRFIAKHGARGTGVTLLPCSGTRSTFPHYAATWKTYWIIIKAWWKRDFSRFLPGKPSSLSCVLAPGNVPRLKVKLVIKKLESTKFEVLPPQVWCWRTERVSRTTGLSVLVNIYNFIISISWLHSLKQKLVIPSEFHRVHSSLVVWAECTAHSGSSSLKRSDMKF